MKKIKWLTEKQVQKAAERGRKAALLCSIKHWEQLSSADKKQILGLPQNYLTCDFCTLCTKYKFSYIDFFACLDCGLYCLVEFRHRPAMWYKAANAFTNYRSYKDTLDWINWKRASKMLLRKIIRLYESEYGTYKRRS